MEIPKTSLTAPAHPLLRAATWFTAAVIAVVALYLAARLFLPNNWHGGMQTIATTLQGNAFWIALAIGIAAQAVDGALGMGYGVTASSFLLGTGASPAVASASTHIAKLFTTGVSGIAHAKYGNVDRKLFVRLLVPGMAGGMLGVLLVTQIDGRLLKPFVAAYLLVIGLYILAKAYRSARVGQGEPRHAAKLGLFGGFVDAVGGGGWGPVVTSSLVGSGTDPRTTIGSVNFAEFFMTLATAASFTFLAVEGTWPVVAGLVIGGLFAAPFAALLCRSIRPRVLLISVGILITALSAWNFYRALA
ncbi:MAG TPA: sulfite exporter TauE/SafE family protein [Burkholderiales bacterium]